MAHAIRLPVVQDIPEPGTDPPERTAAISCVRIMPKPPPPLPGINLPPPRAFGAHATKRVRKLHYRMPDSTSECQLQTTTLLRTSIRSLRTDFCSPRSRVSSPPYRGGVAFRRFGRDDGVVLSSDSPPYKGGVASASDDGVVLSSVPYLTSPKTGVLSFYRRTFTVIYTFQTFITHYELQKPRIP